MKLKLQHRVFQAGATPRKREIDLPALVDKSILPIGTCSVLAGIGASAIGLLPAADYLLAAGVLFQLVSWIGDWWKYN